MPANPQARPTPSRVGFTLVEVLFSMVLLLLLTLVLFQMIQSASGSYKNMVGQVSAFQEASSVFDAVTRNVGEATLRTYLDYCYLNQDPTQPPLAYVRKSDLHFIAGPATSVITSTAAVGIDVSPSHAVFFQAPLDYTNTTYANAAPASNPNYNDVPGLLTGCGYFVSFDVGKTLGIPGLSSDQKKRFRLMKLFEPTESLEVYQHPSTNAWATDPTARNAWFNDALTRGNARAIADNVVAFFIEPKCTAADQAILTAPLAPMYAYDSRGGYPEAANQPVQQDQLPPLLHVTMVAIDEISASRLAPLTNAEITGSVFANAPFTQTTDYNKDMTQLETNLTALRMNYRVFTTDVPIRAAKWSPN